MEAEANGDDDHHQLAPAAVADTNADAEAQQMRRRVEQRSIVDRLISILQQKDEFPERQREEKIFELAERFVNDLGDDVYEMVTDQRHGDNYRGLDSNRDTEAEVETALRFYPEVLSRRGGEYNDELPIERITHIYDANDNRLCNVKAVSFISLFARLAIEFGAFEKFEKGGLLAYNGIVLRSLVYSSSHKRYDEEHHRRNDDVYLQQLIRLRRDNLLQKEDIIRYNVVHALCGEYYYFSERRFRFLVEWIPTSLIRADSHGWLPLHYVRNYESLRPFETVFEFVVRYYPNKIGINLLFRKRNNISETPMQIACRIFERNDVMRAVEDVLARYSDTTPINMAEALLMAVTDDNVHLDCTYFLLRRQPDLVLRRMTETTTSFPNCFNSNDDDVDDCNSYENKNLGVNKSDEDNTCNNYKNDDPTYNRKRKRK